MKVYDTLSQWSPLRRNYSLKFLFVAFLGIHIPLIGIILYLVIQAGPSTPAIEIIVATLLLTLFATVGTLIILNKLLAPLRLASASLDDYIHGRNIPALPTHYTDEAGTLLRNIQQTIQTIEDLLDDKKDLVGLVSHDLRSPLTKIDGLTQILLIDPAAAADVAPRIIEICHQQSGLLNGILNLLRHDHDWHPAQTDLQEVHLKKLIDQSLRQFDLHISQKQLNIIVTIPENLTVCVNPDTFREALKNLIHNAIKFSFRKGTIQIEATTTDTHTTLSIRDSGTGLELHDCERIFDRFTSVGKTGTENEPSTGLGLYLSRKIVQKHGGLLTVSSPGRNQGSVFTISLPVDVWQDRLKRPQY